MFASRVVTPRGSTTVTGLELMTALHPPTRASEPDETGKRHSELNPGSLGKGPVDCAPCAAPDGHPLLKDLPRFHVRGPAEKLIEEAYDWARPMTDAECTLRHLVGIDVDMPFAAGANGLVVGLGAPTHVKAPVFDPKLPGSWLVDLSQVDLSRVRVGKDTWADLDAGRRLQISALPPTRCAGQGFRRPRSASARARTTSCRDAFHAEHRKPRRAGSSRRAASHCSPAPRKSRR